LDKIRDEGAGIVVYLRQEGRGIGLANKVRAYELQDEGADTVQANERLGFEPDRRNFAVAASILISLNVQTVRLMTNNPDKTNTLSRFGVHVSERVPLVVPADVYMERYLETKRTKLGHLI
jgi:GTP cyclohydrolase II